VLPYLVPQLTASPVNTKALSILASVAGEALNRHLARILPALLTSLAESHGQSNETQELQYCQVSYFWIHIYTMRVRILHKISMPVRIQ
jgi:hypothetical protein